MEIVGVGIPTPRGFRYEGLVETECESSFLLNTETCFLERSYRPLVQMSVFGDGTVMGQSAEGYKDEKETYYVDLNTISSINNFEFNHANMTETLQVQNLVFQALFSDSFSLPAHVFSSRPVNTEAGYTIEQIASPVQISTKDSEGRVTGVVQEADEWVVKTEIPGSQYFEFAGVKYLVVPRSSENRVTSLQGTGHGGYSYFVDTIKPGTIQKRMQQIINASTTPTMKAEIVVDGGEFGDISVDYNGDGVLDAISRWNGETELLDPGQTVDAASSTASVSDLIEELVAGKNQSSSQSSGTRVGVRQSVEPSGLVAGLSTDASQELAIEHQRLYLILQKIQKVLDLYELMNKP
jgi:hypothetical protein